MFWVYIYYCSKEVSYPCALGSICYNSGRASTSLCSEIYLLLQWTSLLSVCSGLHLLVQWLSFHR